MNISDIIKLGFENHKKLITEYDDTILEIYKYYPKYTDDHYYELNIFSTKDKRTNKPIYYYKNGLTSSLFRIIKLSSKGNLFLSTIIDYNSDNATDKIKKEFYSEFRNIMIDDILDINI